MEIQWTQGPVEWKKFTTLCINWIDLSVVKHQVKVKSCPSNAKSKPKVKSVQFIQITMENGVKKSFIGSKVRKISITLTLKTFQTIHAN